MVQKKNTRRKSIGETSVLVFPNLFTTGNLFCGFYSIISSLNGNYVLSAYLILAAALFDLFDGRVARLVKGVSNFGKQYDSISDIVSFGIAPIVLVYVYWFIDMPKFTWLIGFLFVSCGTIRLAKFNVIPSSRPDEYFSGLPIPVAASTIASAFLFLRAVGRLHSLEMYILGTLVLLSILMVSPVRYKSYKKPETPSRNKVISNTVMFVLLLILVAINPDIVVFILCSSYIIVGIVFESYRRLFKRE